MKFSEIGSYMEYKFNALSKVSGMERNCLFSNILLTLTAIVFLTSCASTTSIPSTYSSSETASYINHGNGTVTHKQSGLMWKKCSEGKAGNNCQGVTKSYTWDEAVENFKQHSFSGYSDWRLPTAEEVQTLVICTNGVSIDKAWRTSCMLNGMSNFIKPTIDIESFPNTSSSYFWTSSEVERDKSHAWIISFYSGSGSWGKKNGKNAVRLVREVK